MAHKYPLMKPMLLMKSDIEINGNTINVKMHIKGADFLRAKKTDKKLESLIKKLFGKDYKIELEEVCQKQLEEQREKEIEKIEQNAIKLTCSYVSGTNQNVNSNIENQNNPNINNVGIPEYNDPDYMPPQDSDYIPENLDNMPINTIISIENNIPELPEEEDEEDTPLILGKNMNITAPLEKVKNLTVDDGAVCLDGEIITMEDKELKSGKILLSFDLYDGTSTLTCKAFLDKNKAKK